MRCCKHRSFKAVPARRACAGVSAAPVQAASKHKAQKLEEYSPCILERYSCVLMPFFQRMRYGLRLPSISTALRTHVSLNLRSQIHTEVLAALNFKSRHPYSVTTVICKSSLPNSKTGFTCTGGLRDPEALRYSLRF